jgi:hypothetical protein
MRPTLYFAVITAASFPLACVSGPLLAANPELKEAEAQTPPGRLPTVIRLYEWRVLRAAPGKLDALHSRLRGH